MDKEYVDRIVRELFAAMAAENVKIYASDGGIWHYATKMGTRIEGREIEPTDGIVLNIPNYNLFLEKIEKYLEVAEKFYEADRTYFEIYGEEFSKRVLLDLFLNATSYDFYNIYNYIDSKKKMLETPVLTGKLELGELSIGNQNLKIVANIRRLKFNMEAPYAFELSFSDGNESFVLPSVLFGVCGNEINIFAIQNLHKNQSGALSKKLDRFFRKIDSGIVQKGVHEIPYEQREIEEQVTINSVVAAAVFLNFFKEIGIKKFVSPDFSPLRYSTKLNQKIENEIKLDANKNLQDVKEAAEDEMDKNQFNMTDKLFNTLMRLRLHFSNLGVDYDSETGKIVATVLQGNYAKSSNLLQIIIEATSLKKRTRQRN